MTRISFEVAGDAKEAMTLVQQHVPGATNIQSNNADGSITKVDGVTTGPAPGQSGVPSPTPTQQAEQAAASAAKSTPSAPRTGR
jgi:hypothetical protein